MRVFFFGLSPRCTNLVNSQSEFVQLILLIFALLVTSLHACVCLYLWHDFWYMLFWFKFIDTCMLACARHLASFYVLVGLLSYNPWTCMSRFRSLDRGDPLRGDQSGGAIVWWINGRMPVAFFIQPFLSGTRDFLLLLLSIYHLLYIGNLFVNCTFSFSGDVILDHALW